MKSRFVPSCALALALLLSAAPVPAAGPDAASLAARVDAIFAAWTTDHTPGGAVAIYKDGKVVYAKGYGMADLERNVPITSKTVFDIGSTSKQFTAACIHMLAREGKLSLDDDIRKHLPEIPAYDAPITIRHLLYHTSGLRDYLTIMALAGMSERNDYSDRQVLDIIARQRALNFKPGEEHLYSNTGYYLLGEIVRRASGTSLRRYADERIFKPLGMTNTRFNDDTSDIVKNRAIGYSPNQDGGFRTDMSIFHVVGDGAVQTSVEDLALWDRNFYDSKLTGGPELIAAMLVPAKLNNGETLDYASGLRVAPYRGLREISHGGAWVGYRAQMLRFPDERVGVVVLSNSGPVDTTDLAHKVADIYLEGKFPKPAVTAAEPASGPAPAAAPAVELSAKALEARVGLYRDVRDVRYRRLILDGGKLIYSRGAGNVSSPLAPLAEDRFRMEGATVATEVSFPAPAAGARQRMVVTSVDGTVATFERVEPASPTADDLAAYAGDYASDELDAVVRVTSKDGKLTIRLPNDDDSPPLEATMKDEFTVGGLTVTFTRDAAGKVTGLALGAGRVRNISAVRRGRE